MAKLKTVYVCEKCQSVADKWSGSCPDCGAWNSYVEDVVETGSKGTVKPQVVVEGAVTVRKLHEVDLENALSGRILADLPEFDRVLGGGIVPGSLLVLSGEPGIGKSTLLLQVLGQLRTMSNIVYVAGEESTSQIKTRALRLGSDLKNVAFWETSFLDVVLEKLRSDIPDFIVVDSVSVMRFSELDSAPGSLPQMRMVADRLMHFAKKYSVPIVMIGHVTKEGSLAGPRVFEHMVDVVLHLEGQRHADLRLLRCFKNRFGSTQEVGMFKMKQSGLEGVADPGKELLKDRPEHVIGSALSVTIDGRRPFLVEIQALVNRTAFGYPKRSATGFDLNRLHMLIAVLEKYHGLKLAEHDVFVNVIGGLKIKEPGCDLAVIEAIKSSYSGKAISGKQIHIGEVGLDGKVRDPLLSEVRQSVV